MQSVTLEDAHPSPSTHQSIAIGRATLSLPLGIDPKPYIRTLLKLELESIQNPTARTAIARGIAEAETDADFSSLLETFHLFSSPANADRLIAAMERSKEQELPSQSVESLREEFGLGQEAP
jgi:PHD/YefM family antitoxin component YafN of YafNO toxin-antitoxin module